MAQSKIKTRLLIISDTHSTSPSSASSPHPFRHPLPQDIDVLIHCGDLTTRGLIPEHEATLDYLKKHPAPLKIIIPGNHDLTLDRPYYWTRDGGHGIGYRDGKRRKFGGYGEDDLAKIRELYVGEEARRKGVVYLEEGKWEGVLGNGARLKVWASCWTPEFCGWAFAYERHDDRFQGMPEFGGEDGVDVVVTHGPPQGVLDATAHGGAGCAFLMQAVRRAKPAVHCFGHIHEGWGGLWKGWNEEDGGRRVQVDEARTKREMGAYVDATQIERGKETLFVNAAIMDVKYKPVQALWVVDVLLDKAEVR